MSTICEDHQLSLLGDSVTGDDYVGVGFVQGYTTVGLRARKAALKS